LAIAASHPHGSSHSSPIIRHLIDSWADQIKR
jgi:hypothetical protein